MATIELAGSTNRDSSGILRRENERTGAFANIVCGAIVATTLLLSGAPSLARDNQETHLRAQHNIRLVENQRSAIMRSYEIIAREYTNAMGPLDIATKTAQAEVESGFDAHTINTGSVQCGYNPAGLFGISQGCAKDVTERQGLKVTLSRRRLDSHSLALLSPYDNAFVSGLIDRDNLVRLKRMFPECKEITAQMILAAHAGGKESILGCDRYTAGTTRYVNAVLKERRNVETVISEDKDTKLKEKEDGKKRLNEEKLKILILLRVLQSAKR